MLIRLSLFVWNYSNSLICQWSSGYCFFFYLYISECHARLHWHNIVKIRSIFTTFFTWLLTIRKRCVVPFEVLLCFASLHNSELNFTFILHWMYFKDLSVSYCILTNRELHSHKTGLLGFFRVSMGNKFGVLMKNQLPILTGGSETPSLFKFRLKLSFYHDWWLKLAKNIFAL